MPCIIAFKVIYICFDSGGWYRDYIVVHFVSFIPFFGEYFVVTYYDPSLYYIQQVKDNSRLGSLILAGGLGACFGHLICELVPIVFYMDNTGITSQVSYSGAQGTSSSGGLNLPQGSSSGDQSDIEYFQEQLTAAQDAEMLLHKAKNVELSPFEK